MSKIGLINGGVIVQGNDNIFPYEQLDTTWNDLRFPVSGLATGPTKQPTLAMWNDNGSGSDGIFLRSFANDEHMFLAGQMSHEWKSGTIIFPHFHIMASDANVGDINFGIEYSWININDTADVNTTIITGETSVNNEENVNKILALPEIVGTGKTLSSQFVARIFRSATDTYASEVWLMEFDLHFEIDTTGSRQAFIK